MPRINSRRKGNQAERDVIKILRQYFPGPWERKPMGIPGPDIQPPDDFPYAIEVKNHKSLRFKHLYEPTKLLLSFIKQAMDQAKDLKRDALLVIKIEGIWMCCQGFEYRHFAYPSWSVLTDWCDDRTRPQENG